MADLIFNTTAGQTISRDWMLAFLNTSATTTPTWSLIGKRVEESDVSYDYNVNTTKDIVGNTWNTMSRPTVTQDFDPYPLDAGDPAAVKIWNMAVKDQDHIALANQDMLIVHKYAGSSATSCFAERYQACAVAVSRLGGTGGEILTDGLSVTYGGQRTVGTATVSTSGVVTFTAGS